MSAANGREAVLYRVKPGQICLQTFTCLIEKQNYSATGVAETDLKGELVTAPDFWRRMAEEEGFRREVFSAVALRFDEYQQLVEDLALTGFDARLARVLLKLADQDGVVRMTHEALAAETASGRAFVSRRIAELERNGILRRQRGAVCILQRVKLQDLAAQ